MSYQQYVRKMAKGPMALTVYIIFSTLVLMQFIALFLGRWIDLLEFGVNVLMVTVMWMLFAKCVSKKPCNIKPIATCTFVYAIIRLVSIGITAIGIIIVCIYTCVKHNNYWGNFTGMLVGGIIGMVLGIAVCALRVIISIKGLSECAAIKKSNSTYILKNNWFILMIMLAGARLISMITQLVFSGLTGTGLNMVGYSSGYNWTSLLDNYTYEGSTFARLIRSGSDLSANVMVIIIDLLYIAVFVILAVMMAKYRKNTKGLQMNQYGR